MKPDLEHIEILTSSHHNDLHLYLKRVLEGILVKVSSPEFCIGIPCRKIKKEYRIELLNRSTEQEY